MFLYVLFISLRRNRFYVSFVYSANEFDKGNGHLDVFLPQLPDTPILSLDQTVSCDDIKKAIPNLVCPIKANAEIKGTVRVSDLTRLPTGNYIIVVNITNDKNQPCFCGKFHYYYVISCWESGQITEC